MEKPDAHSYMEQLKDMMEISIKYGDASVGIVERAVKIVNGYYIALRQWGELEAKKNRNKERAKVSEFPKKGGNDEDPGK